jgi:hypothetical protein
MTGKKAASDAAKLLAKKTATKAEKTVAASDLAQTPKKAPAKGTKGRSSGKK